MTINDARRSEMYLAIRDSLGADVADTLMESLPPHDWSGLARTSDITVLRTELDMLRSETGSRLTTVENDIDRLFKATGWVIGVTTTFGIATIALLVQLSFAVAGLK